jgi:hypothetical protein
MPKMRLNMKEVREEKKVKEEKHHENLHIKRNNLKLVRKGLYLRQRCKSSLGQSSVKNKIRKRRRNDPLKALLQPSSVDLLTNVRFLV